MRMDYWTKERIATLKRLWAQGLSAGEIGQRLGDISRSAVLGKIFRLRLGEVQKPRKKVPRGAKAAKPGPRRKLPKDQPARRRGAALTAPAPPSRATRKTLFELTNQCCRWPYGERGARNFFFCGAPGADIENGTPYCVPHMKRAYIVAPDKATSPGSNKRFATSLTPWRVVPRAA